MKPVLIVYATREGHTRRIAEHIAATIRSRGAEAELQHAADLPPEFTPEGYRAAVLAASVHAGKHEAEMVEFVRRHRAALEGMRSVFLSVSLTEAGAEDAARPAGEREKAAAAVQGMIDAFLKETGWHPERVQPVAGALMYSRYNLLMKLMMKWIAKREGASTDTSRDHEFTDWAALDRLADEVLAAHS
ncbi:MAG: hypothetical protein K2X35_11885 [Bryobacteraceae bacterium]|nr:hypothetical protein [Bryobacteraceae bacterium]